MSQSAPEDRRSPEEFLRLIEQTKRGRLKVYIGHAAGTGKTVQMLREGNELRARGKDVVAGYIETHGRARTDAEVRDLSVIPRKQIEYKGAIIEEMDLDAVLKRHPEIAIVDELAHTNAPGSKNKKRWEDVDNILDAGISVITAVNIQHIESLNAAVEQITGIKVQEKVPDSFLEQADQIINLDIASDDLRDRIRRGEIYAQEKVEQALGHFFTTRNLSSLRELALREVAHFLDQVRRRNVHRIGGDSENEQTAQAGEKPGRTDAAMAAALAEANVDPVVMVAISSRPPDVRSLLRKAAAIANRLNTHWYLVYVETPGESATRIDATTQRLLYDNISLAKDLGAIVFRLRGTDVAKSLADFAQEYGVTHAIFGAPHAPGFFEQARRLFRPNLITRFSLMMPEIDVHLCGRRARLNGDRLDG